MSKLINLDGLTQIVNKIKDLINSKVGNLETLNTADKNNLVDAVNEVNINSVKMGETLEDIEFSVGETLVDRIKQLEDNIENIDAKLYYPASVSTAIVFDDLNNDVEPVPMPDEFNEIMEYSFSEFQGEIPIITVDEVYLVRITYSDNTVIRALGGIGEEDPTLPSGSIPWIFYSIHGWFKEPFVYAYIIGDAKVSDDKTNFIFEENNNSVYFLFKKGQLPDSVPVKLEFIVVPSDEADEKINNGGSEEEIINSFNSYFMETTEKTLEINNEFFKTYKFVTQDMINDIGNADNLSTNDKTIVGAINELFQDVDSGKEIIADAIDDNSITKDSTFAAMGEAIEGIRADAEDAANTRSTLANLMTQGGYAVTGEEDIDTLLGLLTVSGIKPADVKQIACGMYHTFILKNNGSLWACGFNGDGQLGLGDTTNRTKFTQVTTNINNDVEYVVCGYYHTFIIKNDGSVYSCGRNNNGQLGLNDTTDRNTFTQVTTNINNDVKQIACGMYHTYILKNDGGVWSCGKNDYGQLGLGNKTNQKTFTKVTTNINNDVKQIACGQYHIFILKNNGSVLSCGLNDFGQLGLGDTTNRTTFTYLNEPATADNNTKQVVCGQYHTFILKNNGSLWSCGDNYRCQLGLGDNTDRSTFTQVTTNINNDVEQVDCGFYHTIILKNDGSVYSCGNNDYGQLGFGDSTQRSTFTQVTTNISNDVKQVVCGHHFAFILKNDGSIWACGRNDYGQLGLGDTTNRDTFTETYKTIVFV